MKKTKKGYVILEEQYSLSQLKEFYKASLRPNVIFRDENDDPEFPSSHWESIFCCDGDSECFYCNGKGYRKDIFEDHSLRKCPVVLGTRIGA